LRQFIDKDKSDDYLTEKARNKKDEETIIWYVLGTLALILCIIYYMVILFTICDADSIKLRELKQKTIDDRIKRERSQLQRTADRQLPMVARGLSVGSKLD
jgi:hypothetical protein